VAFKTSKGICLKTRILAIDYGRVRIGLALSDEQKIIASPLENLLAEKELAKTVAKISSHIDSLEKEKRCKIEEIVIGLPLKMDGKDSETTALVRAFYELLKTAVTVPVQLFDERLTSVQADRALKELQLTRKKRAQFVDRTSAIILLQSYLEKRRVIL
jgi:putative Holliday junction resolvase